MKPSVGSKPARVPRASKASKAPKTTEPAEAQSSEAVWTPRTRRRKGTSPPPATIRPFGCPVDRLKIGPFDYRVIFEGEAWQNENGWYGLHDPDTHTISLSNTRNRHQMAEVALHEIDHAVWHVGNFDDIAGESREESFCSRHATGLTQIARDNLGFFAWWLSLLS